MSLSNNLESVPNHPTSATFRPTPIISQPSGFDPDRISFNKNFLLSIDGILRIAIIVSQFAGWVSAAAIPNIHGGQIYMPPEFISTRDAYLFFSISGFIIAICFLLLYTMNIIVKKPFSKLPILLFILTTDVLWIIPTFVLAIVCAMREGSMKDPSFQFRTFVNIGAYASASFFGFLCSLLYAIDAVFHLMKAIRGAQN